MKEKAKKKIKWKRIEIISHFFVRQYNQKSWQKVEERRYVITYSICYIYAEYENHEPESQRWHESQRHIEKNIIYWFSLMIEIKSIEKQFSLLSLAGDEKIILSLRENKIETEGEWTSISILHYTYLHIFHQFY